MERRRNLTNEIVTKKFQNQFDLVNYAISIAANIIHSGRQGSLGENPALEALEEIATGRDKMPIVEIDEEIEIFEEEEEEEAPKKRSKKTEKALTE